MSTQTADQLTAFNKTQTIEVPTFSFQAQDFVVELRFPLVRRQRQLPGWPQAWLTKHLWWKMAGGEKKHLNASWTLISVSCELHNRDTDTDISAPHLVLAGADSIAWRKSPEEKKEGVLTPMSHKTGFCKSYSIFGQNPQLCYSLFRSPWLSKSHLAIYQGTKIHGLNKVLQELCCSERGLEWTQCRSVDF